VAVFVVVGGYVTIGFAFYAMARAVPAAAKEAAQHTAQLAASAAETARLAQERASGAEGTLAAVGAEQMKDSALDAKTAADALDTILKSLGGLFADLGKLSPPVAALCVALLMFLTAGGIAVADRLV
jgi:hypothetical protein